MVSEPQVQIKIKIKTFFGSVKFKIKNGDRYFAFQFPSISKTHLLKRGTTFKRSDVCRSKRHLHP